MSHTDQSISHKVGATFSYSGFIELPAGDWSGACQAYHATTGALVQEFDVTLTPPVDPATETGVNIRAEASDTASWADGVQLKCDVVFYDAGSPQTKVPTQTFVIKTIAKVTNVE